MDIITVVGSSKSGKSESIRYALIELISKYDFKLLYNSKRYPNSKNEFLRRFKKEWSTPKGLVGQITCVGNLN